jgi:hypothetical protein
MNFESAGRLVRPKYRFTVRCARKNSLSSEMRLQGSMGAGKSRWYVAKYNPFAYSILGHKKRYARMKKLINTLKGRERKELCEPIGAGMRDWWRYFDNNS